MLGDHLFHYILFVDLAEPLQFAVLFGLLDLLLNRDQVIDATRLSVELL